MSSELISIKTALWFNSELLNIPMDSTLLRQSIPSPDFIKQLEDASGQAWFDGAKSVVDQWFNDGMDHLPLWIISYWEGDSKVPRIMLSLENQHVLIGSGTIERKGVTRTYSASPSVTWKNFLEWSNVLLLLNNLHTRACKIPGNSLVI